MLLPGDAHEYLSQLYGPDYMTPPPRVGASGIITWRSIWARTETRLTMKNAKTLARIALSALIRVLLLPLCLLPIRKNRVLFVSYRGKQYSCSPRAISEALEKMSGGEIEIGWAFHRRRILKRLRRAASACWTTAPSPLSYTRLRRA